MINSQNISRVVTMKSKYLLKDMESILLNIERRKYFNCIEADRPVKCSDVYLLFFAIECLNYFIENNDFRYLNLALKIRDSKNVIGDKNSISQLSKCVLKRVKSSMKL